MKTLLLLILAIPLLAQPTPTVARTSPHYVNADPGNCQEGETIYNLTTHLSKICNSSGQWQIQINTDTSGNTTLPGTLNIGGTVAGVNLPITVTQTGYAADNTGVVNATTIINSAITAAGGAILPVGSYRIQSPGLTITSNQQLKSFYAPERWRGAVSKVTLFYYGSSGCAINITSAAGVTLDGITLEGFELNGSNATGTAKGICIDGSAASSAVEGVLIRDVAVRDFPNNHIYGIGTVFDLAFDRLTASNANSSTSSDLVYVSAGSESSSQISCNDCWLANYTDGQWAFHTVGVGTVRFTNGTVAPVGATTGANGIWESGGQLTLTGTSIEAGVVGTTSVGARYTGNGGVFYPGSITNFHHGLEIGDPTSIPDIAQSLTVAGQISGNGAGSSPADIFVVHGGSRSGNVIMPYYGAVVYDDRQVTDDVLEVTSILNGVVQLGASTTAGYAQWNVGPTSVNPNGSVNAGPGSIVCNYNAAAAPYCYVKTGYGNTGWNPMPNMNSGAGVPATNCTAGAEFFLDTTNHNLYGCIAANTWARLN